MKKLLIALFAFCALPAEAGLVCASAPELKVLQSTALQQQLMVAALTCHMREDYGRFVAAYRDGLVQSDRALKSFFAARPRGEDYNAYKSRIVNAASLRSTHDPRFCDSARKVFDLALGRRMERRGLAPEPPQLVDTGYEGCRAIDNAKLANARPAVNLVLAPKPVPRPPNAPVKLAAAHAASLRMAKPVPALKPVVTADAGRALASRSPNPVKQAIPKPAAPSNRQRTIDGPIMASAEEKPSRFVDVAPNPPAAELSLRESVPPGQAWRTADADDPYKDNPIPNAYRPGAEWVSDPHSPPPVWHPTSYGPPRWRRPHARWILGPDGRWMLVTSRGPR